MQILVADESRAVRAITRAALQQTRFGADGVRDAGAGDQAVSWIHTRPAGPAVVIADWDLPGMDGIALMDLLEELRVIDEVGVLFCVNPLQVPLAEAAVQRGARGYVVRPFSDDDLRAKVEAVATRDVATRSAPPSDVLRDIVTHVRARQELPSLLSLPSGIISELFAVSTRVHAIAGETLVWPGQQIGSLSFITAGEVEVRPANPEATDVRGAGECFAERAFICGEPARITVKARTAVEIVQVPKVRMVELARRHASLRSFLSMLLTEPVPAAEPDCELTGSLQSLPFADLLQFLNATRKTGLLLLDGEGAQGVLYFSQGEAYDAQAGELTGEAAFFAMSGWAHARFQFRGGESAGRHTLERPTLRLLIDAYAKSEAAMSAALAG